MQKSRSGAKRKRLRHTKLDLYVVRIQQNGKLTNARPCTYWLHALKQAGVKRVFYTDWDGKLLVEHVHEMKSEHTSRGQEMYLKNKGKIIF